MELLVLPPGPVDLSGNRGALEGQLDRARKVAVFVRLLRKVCEHLGLATTEAEVPKRLQRVLEQRPGGRFLARRDHVRGNAITEIRGLDLVTDGDELLEALLVGERCAVVCL